MIGNEALYINPSEHYDLHWPIMRGRLNLHGGPGGSLTAVLADLEVIWGTAIQNFLEIPLKDLKASISERIVLIVMISLRLNIT